MRCGTAWASGRARPYASLFSSFIFLSPISFSLGGSGTSTDICCISIVYSYPSFTTVIAHFVFLSVSRHSFSDLSSFVFPANGPLPSPLLSLLSLSYYYSPSFSRSLSLVQVKLVSRYHHLVSARVVSPLTSSNLRSFNHSDAFSIVLHHGIT